MKGLAPLSPAVKPVGVDHVQVDALTLISDEAKALVLGPMLDMRRALEKGQASELTLKAVNSLIRRVTRGLYEYELRRIPEGPVDIDTTRW